MSYHIQDGDGARERGREGGRREEGSAKYSPDCDKDL
jgi:hypothetical protein